MSICARFGSSPYGWKSAPIVASVSSSSASSHGVAYGKPCWAAADPSVAAAHRSVRWDVRADRARRPLERRLQPRRGVREARLGGGEPIVGGAERLGEAPGDA